MNNSTNPFLLGNFAPVLDELDIKKLEVIGEVPHDLLGIYMRNGPNPAFPPISYTYPYDGDGMIHAIYIAQGQAAYKNRFVETKGLAKERKAGKALYSRVC
ncbi:Carotenoid cleavage oxygenase [Legionella sainthelensi]|uniref:Carotenoid cleavage oxygenase n=1 Tax=Legionella sainthelensi TaxID=28087 RepID=A0A0W0YQ56_9GAMM|nr:carotenoid oxygenase family protein [Legionella sainthelensi]KTD58987.1 Carotenoid cleavage oxygenase [Legionella sainthelensi]VEH27873.1 8'-apo-beta-carotenal 15,15'-oxygenase [Legionella sainthelensi]